MREITRAQVDAALKAKWHKTLGGGMIAIEQEDWEGIKSYISQLEARVGVLEAAIKPAILRFELLAVKADREDISAEVGAAELKAALAGKAAP